VAADPYQTLGVARGAAEADIKKAYRKLAKELHPDRNKDNKQAAERFSKVTNAYDLLSDKDKRARFDRGEIDGDGNPTAPFGFGQGAGPRPGGQGGGFRSQGFEFGGGEADMSDIFEGLFGGRAGGGGFASGFGGGRRQPPQKGATVNYSLKVPFADAATLEPQRVQLPSGAIDIKLPAGVDTGTKVRLAGKGEQGPGGAGDAFVTIEVTPHRFFTRDGDDIRLDLPISLAEAVAGGQVKVPTVERPVMLTVPKGASSGRTLRLKGKGFHRKDGTRGDQLVTLMVQVPANDAALEQFVAGWAGAEGNPRAALGV
jgi:DnaJ-class molecular chaperone